MPFGSKPGGDGQTVHFNRVYEDLLKPALQARATQPFDIYTDRKLNYRPPRCRTCRA